MKLSKIDCLSTQHMVIHEAVRHKTDTHDFKSKTEFSVQARIPLMPFLLLPLIVYVFW